MLTFVQQHAWSLTLVALGALLLAMWAAPRMKPTIERARSRLAQARREGRATGATPRPRPRHDPVGAVARDAEELARHLAAQIDAKAERLERLIRLADERLAALEEAAAEGLLDAPRVGRGGAARMEESDGARTPRIIGAGATALTGGVTLESDPITRRVHELADEGRSAREISHALGEHLGKVQLILALRG